MITHCDTGWRHKDKQASSKHCVTVLGMNASQANKYYKRKTVVTIGCF